MLRAAVIGCGLIGGAEPPEHPDVGVYTHAQAWTRTPGVELVALCDADGDRAEAAAVRWGAPIVATDAAAMLEAVRPDLVSVATPDASHADVVALALAAPATRGVLAEKPLAVTTDTARALTAQAAERGVALAVNHSRRWSPTLRALVPALHAGVLGTPQVVHGGYVKGLRHNGSHWLDLLRMLCGEPVVTGGRDRLGEGGDDPTLDATLVLGNGAPVHLTGLDTTRFTHFELELVLTGARVRVLESGHVVEVERIAEDPRHPGHRVLGPAERTAGALRDVMLHATMDLVRAARTGAAPACTGADGVAALELADAVAACILAP